jgi:hypothetical protein
MMASGKTTTWKGKELTIGLMGESTLAHGKMAKGTVSAL